PEATRTSLFSLTGLSSATGPRLMERGWRAAQPRCSLLSAIHSSQTSNSGARDPTRLRDDRAIGNAESAGTCSSAMRDLEPLAGSGSLQAQMALQWREVTVAVQQGVTALDTECADEEVYRLSDRDLAAARSDGSPRPLGQFCVNKKHDFKLAQRIFHQACFHI